VKLEAFLKPESIAVIGASRDPEKAGHKIFRNLLESGYEGGLYPVNPKATELLGRKCYRSVMDVQGEVDLALIAVPAKIVPAVAEECGEKGVKGLVVISAGFSETGREGTKLERRLASLPRNYKYAQPYECFLRLSEPAAWKNSIHIAERGSWKRDPELGEPE